MRFERKVALVTGGGAGIGQAAALRFAREGADVIVVDRREDYANAVAQAIREFGRLDVVFANAGVIHVNAVREMPVQEWDNVIRINLRGIFLTCKHSIDALIQSGGGAIVTMGSSTAGWDTLGTGAAYMASKEGVTGLTKSLALQLAGYQIRVNAVCPGVIKTRLGERADASDEAIDEKYRRFAERIPLRQVGLPEDVASAVAYLASDEARHITGAMLLIDGGQTLQSWSNAPDGDVYPLFDARLQ